MFTGHRALLKAASVTCAVFAARPTFVVAPGNKVVGVGRRLSIKCVVTASPPPAVYWSNVASQVSHLQRGAYL